MANNSSKLQIIAVIICGGIPQRQLVTLLSQPLTRRLIALNYKCDGIIFRDWGERGGHDGKRSPVKSDYGLQRDIRVEDTYYS